MRRMSSEVAVRLVGVELTSSSPRTTSPSPSPATPTPAAASSTGRPRGRRLFSAPTRRRSDPAERGSSATPARFFCEWSSPRAGHFAHFEDRGGGGGEGVFTTPLSNVYLGIEISANPRFLREVENAEVNLGVLSGRVAPGGESTRNRNGGFFQCPPSTTLEISQEPLAKSVFGRVFA